MNGTWNGVNNRHKNQVTARLPGWQMATRLGLLILLLWLGRFSVHAAAPAPRAAQHAGQPHSLVTSHFSPESSVATEAHMQPVPFWQPDTAYSGPPLVMIWPESGPPDTLVELTGFGFAPGRSVTISASRVGTADVEALLTVRTSTQGTLREIVGLPARAKPGERWQFAVSPVDSIYKAVSNIITLVEAQDPPLVVTTPLPTAVLPPVPPDAIPTVMQTATPTALPTPTQLPPAQPAGSWSAAYFDNATLAETPVTVAQVAEVNFDWGDNAPVPQLSPDNFSARFEQTVNLTDGFYTMSAQADDGIRIFVNNELVVDEWHLGEPSLYRTGQQLSGITTFRIEYYEAGGSASVRFNYERVGEFPDWQATFYNNITLSGEPLWIRAEGTEVDAQLSHQWSLGSPVEGVVPTDNWSGRWTGTFWFEGGDYEFRAESNDGVRVWLDDIIIIDEWSDGANQIEHVFQNVRAGNHTVTVEYYERGGIANLKTWWDRFIP